MKRLIIGEVLDLRDLTFGGMVVNESTMKRKFIVKKAGLKYTLAHVEDKIVVMRRTLKTMNYDIYENIEDVVSDGYEIEQDVDWYFNSLQGAPEEAVTFEPLEEIPGEAVPVPTIKKFSELDIDGMDKEKRVNISQLEIKKAVLAENDDFSYVLFVTDDGSYYVPVEDTTQPAGYSALKIEEEFVFDCEIVEEDIKGIVCDLGKNSMKDLDTKVVVNALPLTFNKVKFDEIYKYKGESRTIQIYKKDFHEHRVTKIDLRGTTIHTYEIGQDFDTTGYAMMYKAYKSTKKNEGITSLKNDKMLGFFKY